MKKIAFRMVLFPGMEAEYRKRHDEIWPELSQLLKETGISDYYIFLDASDRHLFGVMNVADELKLESLPSHPVMRRWWDHMRDIMETHPDHSPVSVPLAEMFHLP